MKKNYYCAIDLGATSGRIVISPANGNNDEMELVRRFPHGIQERNGMYFWDMEFLIKEITEGLRTLSTRTDINILSIGVDTWGCDMIFLDSNGKPLAQPRAYRDPYTNGMLERYFEKVPKEEVYQRTGIQFMPYNTLFQLFACHETNYEPFLKAEHYLFMPDYINYYLSGKMACEYTILSTSQFLNPTTKEIDRKLIEAAGARMECFSPVVMPGTKLGNLLPEVADFGYEIPVIAVAGHDTASAVAAVPTQEGEGYAYLSSGTWSLMGIVSEQPIITQRSLELNFTNEGGVNGTTRVLKNLTGMWILEQCRKEWAAQGKEYSYPELMRMFGEAQSTAIFNTDDPSFANPKSMLKAIADYCEANGTCQPKTDGEIVRAIFESLAARYKVAFAWLQEIAPFKIEKLYVIGGGAQNTLLNQLTEQAIGVPVIAGPTEATGIGNIKMQQSYFNK